MEQKKLNNEGFSLIELIVVIAIMAILVGAMAPMVTKYIEKSRVSADAQALGAVYTAVQTAIADPEITPPASGSGELSALTGDFKTEVEDTLGGTGSISKAYAALKSQKTKDASGGHGSIIVTINGANVSVTAGNISVDATGSHIS